MTALAMDHFTTSEFNLTAEADNINCSPFAAVTAARERFRAQHGPGVHRPRFRATPKEIRKALLAAEMAHWESF